MSGTEVEARAREMGWVPKEEFRLDPTRWVDAQTYVNRGEEILPVLRSNNRKLSEEVVALRTQNTTISQQLKETQAAIEELKNFNSEIAKANAKTRETELLAEITAAREANDTAREVELTNQLTDIKAARRIAETKPVTKPTPAADPSAAPVLTQEMKDWMAANQWFGSDKRKTGYAFGVAEELKAQGLTPGTKPFYDKMDEELAKQFNPNQRRQAPAKVEGANGQGGSQGDPDAKTYADLPPEAKAACEAKVPTLVGKNKAFKDEAAWRAHYVKKYFEQ